MWADWREPLTVEDAATYLLGPILGLVLRLRGFVCLHASAVRVRDHAVAFVGGNGAGKSTLAAKFANLGWPILSDDLLPLRQEDSRVLAEPGYPRLRLWPDSVQQVYGCSRELPPLTPNWDKRYLDLEGCFQEGPLPLAAIYLLGERSATAPGPRFEDVSNAEAYWALVSNTYCNYLLDRPLRAREFDLLAVLLRQAPVRTVLPMSGPGSLDKLSSLLISGFSLS